MADPWPFADPPNVAVFSQQSILKQGQPILLVVHDAEDGAWQFLDGVRFDVNHGMIVGLKTMLRHDPSIAELADLPIGWEATRAAAGEPWERRKST